MRESKPCGLASTRRSPTPGLDSPITHSLFLEQKTGHESLGPPSTPPTALHSVAHLRELARSLLTSAARRLATAACEWERESLTGRAAFRLTRIRRGSAPVPISPIVTPEVANG